MVMAEAGQTSDQPAAPAAPEESSSEGSNEGAAM